MNFDLYPDLLFIEKPYAAVVKPDFFDGKLCFLCLKQERSLSPCDGCNLAWYCSEACKNNDWNQHYEECKVFAGAKGEMECLEEVRENYTLRLVGRVFAKRRWSRAEEEEAWRDTYFSPTFSTLKLTNSYRKLGDLMSHADKRPEKIMRKIYHEFLLLFGTHSDLHLTMSFECFIEIFGTIQTNAVSITQCNPHDGDTSIGKGLYLQMSIFNHSCDPDLTVVSDGHGLCLSFRKGLPPPHPPLQLRDLTISYISRTGERVYERGERRALLEEGYFFTCLCPLCIQDQ